jgi:MFS family permease
MGVGNFLFVPLSMAMGRRCAFLLSNALLLGSVIWAARSETFESHLGARCLQGLTAGVSDCLVSAFSIHSVCLEFARFADGINIATHHRLRHIFPTPS